MATAKYNPIPVIIGVGQINDRNDSDSDSAPTPAPAQRAQALDSLGLMEAALRAAELDAGGGWLSRLESARRRRPDFLS